MSGQSRQRLTVWAGQAKVAMAAAGVAEIIRAPRVTRMPNGPASLLGVTHLRGKVLPVVSLSGLLGGPAGAADRVVVLRREPALGLAVDRVEALKGLTDEQGDLVAGQLLLDDADGARWFDLTTALEAQFAATRAAPRVATIDRSAEVAKAAVADNLVHLGFDLAGQAYALPLEAVMEVAAVPVDILALPRTETILAGVVQRREIVLPILSTRALLGLPDPGLRGDERLVVTRVGGHALGLIVDRISAILRTAPDRLGPAPSLFNRGEGEARIEAVLRMSDGKGLVSVLSPERLLADDRVARLLAGAGQAQEIDTMAQPSQTNAHERFVVMRLGQEQYGLPVGAVDEVIRLPETLTRLPNAPAYVLGVINLRGRVAPIIDLRQRFAVEGAQAGAGRVVMMTLGALQAGFAVDAVATILEVDPDELLPAPDLADGLRVFDRAVERDGEVVLLIDPQALLDRAEADLLRDLTEKSPAS